MKSARARRLSDHDSRFSAEALAPNFEPLSPYPGNNQTPWLGKCRDCGRQISPTYGNLQQGGNACPYCAGARIDPEEARAVYIAAGGTPTSEYPGRNNLPWHGRCNECGSEISPTYANIRRQGRGACNICAKKASGLATRLDPEFVLKKVREWGFEPSEEYPGRVGDKWLMRHIDCGKESLMSFNSLQQGHGCSECAVYSYSMDKPAFFYVVGSELWLKPGITNVPKRRFMEHRMQGLKEVLHLREFVDGRSALEMEKRWLEVKTTRIATDLWATVKDLPNGFTEAVRRLPETERVILDLLNEFTDLSGPVPE